MARQRGMSEDDRERARDNPPAAAASDADRWGTVGPVIPYQARGQYTELDIEQAREKSPETVVIDGKTYSRGSTFAELSAQAKSMGIDWSDLKEDPTIYHPEYGYLVPSEYQATVNNYVSNVLAAPDDKAVGRQWLGGALGFAAPLASSLGAFSSLGIPGGQGIGAAGSAFPAGAEGAAFGGGAGAGAGALNSFSQAPSSLADMFAQAGGTVTDSPVFDTLAEGALDFGSSGLTEGGALASNTGFAPGSFELGASAIGGLGALGVVGSALGGGGDGGEPGMNQFGGGLAEDAGLSPNDWMAQQIAAGGGDLSSLFGTGNPMSGLDLADLQRKLTETVGPAAAKTMIGRLLDGTADASDLARLAGILGSTGLGLLGANDQSNAIRETNATNAAAFKAAQDRAIATLSESEKKALQSSGAGRDAAIKAYQDALGKAVSYNEQALKTGVQGFGDARDASIKASQDSLTRSLGYNENALQTALRGFEGTRDASLAQSNAARNNAMGVLSTAQSGALGANQATQDQYFGLGDQYRDLLEASYAPGFKTSSIAGYDDAVNSSMNATLRGLSTKGNPFDNPGGLMEANRYVTQNTALPAIQNYRAQLGQFGNQGLDTAGQAANQRPNIYGQFGQLQSGLLQNFGQFDANINTQAGNNMANANLQAGQFGTNLINQTGQNVANFTNQAGNNMANATLAGGQFNTNLINQSGNNVANTYSTTGQNDARLIAGIGQTGADVLGRSFMTTPTSNAGMYNALGYGLDQLTNPSTDLAALLRQLNGGR